MVDVALHRTPDYVITYDMEGVRGPLGRAFARQIISTCGPFLNRPVSELRVLDIGCGFGHTARELARVCHSVVGIEPVRSIWEGGQIVRREAGLANLRIEHQSIYERAGDELFDLIVLDNVFEHLPDQPRALQIIGDCLAPGGVVFLLAPNKLWPLEVHYGLPFLSYLPLKLANLYLRLSGRGTDYADASYSPTYFRLKRLLRAMPNCEHRFVLPADLSLTTRGNAWHYRLGAGAIRRFPWLWAISKSLLVIVKRSPTRMREGE